MDFGRLPDLTGVSFTLPALDPRSRPILAAAPANPSDPAASDDAAPWLRAGAPAWARKDWLGRFYPRGTADRDLLRLYAQKLGAIELNASYYRVPSGHTLDAWAADVPASFHFCPKVPKDIAHQRALAASAPAARSFAERFLRLGPRLGPAFLQLPPSAGADLLPELDALLAALPAGFRIAVEFRHTSWFRRGALSDGAFDVLARHGAGAVITDVAGRRDVCHASLTAPFVMVRFVGNGLHPTDLPRADAWLERLLEWRALGIQNVYFFAHQPDDVLAPDLLAHFTAEARARGIAIPDAPLELAPREPAQQLDLFGGAPAETRRPHPAAGRAAPARR